MEGNREQERTNFAHCEVGLTAHWHFPNKADSRGSPWLPPPTPLCPVWHPVLLPEEASHIRLFVLNAPVPPAACAPPAPACPPCPAARSALSAVPLHSQSLASSVLAAAPAAAAGAVAVPFAPAAAGNTGLVTAAGLTARLRCERVRCVFAMQTAMSSEVCRKVTKPENTGGVRPQADHFWSHIAAASRGPAGHHVWPRQNGNGKHVRGHNPGHTRS